MKTPKTDSALLIYSVVQDNAMYFPYYQQMKLNRRLQILSKAFLSHLLIKASNVIPAMDNVSKPKRPRSNGINRH